MPHPQLLLLESHHAQLSAALPSDSYADCELRFVNEDSEWGETVKTKNVTEVVVTWCRLSCRVTVLFVLSSFFLLIKRKKLPTQPPAHPISQLPPLNHSHTIKLYVQSHASSWLYQDGSLSDSTACFDVSRSKCIKTFLNKQLLFVKTSGIASEI